MQDQIKQVQQAFETDLSQSVSSHDLENLRVRYLGKKGPLNRLMTSLKDVPKEHKPELGKDINELKKKIESKLSEAFKTISNQELQERMRHEALDVTLPGTPSCGASKHPMTAIMDELLDVLVHMGFSVQYTPEIESEYYNYSGLNYPEDHPARDMQDTYYLNDETLLRSHNTNVQQRIMEAHNPPIRVASPGKCYRNETISTRSHVIFHQIDVFYVDRGVTFSDLLATKKEFLSHIFNQEVEIRVRPSYFPFVEPGMEVDLGCTECRGKGCKLCKYSGWLEISGAGMVHPNVLREGGIDPEVYSGFAWGGGVERICMLKYGISDIRLFMENDLRFLHQFS